MNSAPDAKIGVSPEEPPAYNQGGLDSSLLDLFCDYRESTLLGQIAAVLIESGYHGALLAKRLQEFHASQYFRNLIDDYRSHISRVGQE
jgi:hypothetical protein